jgi:hypothetical protein
MLQSWREAVAHCILRGYPRRWRQRYELEMQALLAEVPVRWRDLIDLVQSAVGEWEREITRGPFGLLKAVLVAYVTLMIVYGLTAAITTAVAYGYTPGDFKLDPRIVEALVAYPAFGGVLFLTALLFNLPVLIALRLVRGWIPIGLARGVAATGFAIWAMWRLYLFDWYDGPWRHGMPRIGYLVNFFLPIGLAFASAGAIVGGAVVRPRRRDPTRRATR